MSQKDRNIEDYDDYFILVEICNTLNAESGKYRPIDPRHSDILIKCQGVISNLWGEVKRLRGELKKYENNNWP